jgi:cysteine-rich repeat protein
VFNTVPYFGSTTVNLKPFTYNFVFTYVQSSTSYHTGVSIGQINYFMPASRQLNYSLDVGTKSTSGVQILFYANTANKINQLIINILIIQAGFMDLWFNYLWMPFGTTFTSGQSSTQYWSGVTPSVPTSTSSIFQTIIGIDLVASDTTYEIGFSISSVFASSTDINVIIKSLSTKNTKLTSIYVMVFIYNNAKLALVSPAAAYTLATFSSTAANNAALQWSNVNVRSYNTLIGLTSFYIKGDAFFNYMTFVNDGLIAAANSTNNWQQFSFCVNLFRFYYCPDNIPYLMVSTQLCYDICPPRYCTNGSDFQCDACPTYDCYYCSYNGSCSTCNDTLDFRYMNTATMRCLPLPGYYDAGVSQAAPCLATSCLTCVTTATKCLSCYPGKFLSGNTCITCMANCANCTTATNCITCNTFYVFSNSTCQPNCSNITNCLTCNVTTDIICSSCATGYSLVNNTCIQVCGDGMLMTPEACDDGNTNPGDGCSSTCTIETAYYCNTTLSPNLCTHCIVNCDNCSTTTTCTICSTAFTLDVNSTCSLDCSVIAFCATCDFNATLAGTQCLTAQTGYYVQPNNTCVSICGDGIRVAS